MTQRPFVNVNDIELTPQTPQKPEAGFEARVAPIAAPLGATKLGCRLTVVPPGKKAFPHHVHHVNDELFVILSGESALRFGGAIVSTTSIPKPAPMSPMEATVDPPSRGSRLDADHPLNGVLIPCRFTLGPKDGD
jgi:uncharacterized RmlC-like cupin family protein